MPDFSALICKKRVAPGQLPIIIIALSGRSLLNGG